MCAIVSLPDPVASTYAAWLPSKIVKVLLGRPLGEMLMCLPTNGADAVKNMGCFDAQSESEGVMLSKNCTILNLL